MFWTACRQSDLLPASWATLAVNRHHACLLMEEMAGHSQRHLQVLSIPGWWVGVAWQPCPLMAGAAQATGESEEPVPD